jgi:hypothetical protein
VAAHKDRIVIANCGGFWGDDPTAARRQVEGGPVDYLVMDYLAEITMAILHKQRQRRPELGYATDFLVQLRDVLVTCVEQGITIITNAGGVNPAACAQAVEALAAELGVGDRVRTATVTGDDLLDQLQPLLESGETLDHMDTGRPLSDVAERVLSMNVYVGAAPVVKALEMGANVVIAGRVTDTGVTLAPMIHEFGWSPDDWDRLASGIVAGHILECGTQCTGGNFTDWAAVPSFADIGYPLAEVTADGAFTITKHPGTGGMVTVHTVAEQLLYEMGGPGYLCPDCVARFDSIQLHQVGPDRVAVSGIRGGPPPEKLKVAVSFADGYRVFGRMMVGGPHALTKARKAAEILWQAAGGPGHYDGANTQYIGWDACHAPLGTEEPGEILLQVAARDQDRAKLEQDFIPFVVGRTLGSVPALTGPADQGRPRVSDVIGHWPALIARDRVNLAVRVGDSQEAVSCAAPGGEALVYQPAPPEPGDLVATGTVVTVPLERLCLARSGDKGDTANVGVIARSPQIYAWLADFLTPSVLKQHFKDVTKGDVERFEVPNLLAFNFLLHQSLGGGGTLSLNFDAQGKTYAQYLLAMPVDVDQALLDTLPG